MHYSDPSSSNRRKPSTRTCTDSTLELDTREIARRPVGSEIDALLTSNGTEELRTTKPWETAVGTALEAAVS